MSDAPTTAAPTGSAQSDEDTGGEGARRRRLSARARGRRGGFARSRLVATMKYLLPGLAFALLVLVVVWPRLVAEEERFRLEVPAVGPLGGSKPQVINPRVLGVDSDDRPFEISADMGTQTEAEGLDLYLLDNPKADIFLQDGSWVALTARDGRYEMDNKILNLAGDVNVFHDNGYEFHTQTARVNLDDRSASGTDPVRGQGPFGLIDSEGFRILDGGGRILFTGKAHMTVYEGQATGGEVAEE